MSLNLANHPYPAVKTNMSKLELKGGRIHFLIWVWWAYPVEIVENKLLENKQQGPVERE